MNDCLLLCLHSRTLSPAHRPNTRFLPGGSIARAARLVLGERPVSPDGRSHLDAEHFPKVADRVACRLPHQLRRVYFGQTLGGA